MSAFSSSSFDDVRENIVRFWHVGQTYRMLKDPCLVVLLNKGQDQCDLAKPGLHNEVSWQSWLHIQLRS